MQVWNFLLFEPLFYNLSLMNSGIAILEFTCANSREIMNWWNNLVIQHIKVVRWPHSAQNVTEARPDQLQQPQIIAAPTLLQ